MDVSIGEISSTVRAVDGDTLLSPPTLARIVQAVMQVVEDREQHRKRVNGERKVGPDTHGGGS